MKPEPAKNQNDFSGSAVAEPLKNKGRRVQPEKGKDYFMYAESDVKSAVEWLKEELYKIRKEKKVGNKLRNIELSFRRTNELLDKAFEDVK